MLQIFLFNESIFDHETMPTCANVNVSSEFCNIFIYKRKWGSRADCNFSEKSSVLKCRAFPKGLILELGVGGGEGRGVKYDGHRDKL